MKIACAPVLIRPRESTMTIVRDAIAGSTRSVIARIDVASFGASLITRLASLRCTQRLNARQTAHSASKNTVSSAEFGSAGCGGGNASSICRDIENAGNRDTSAVLSSHATTS